MAFISGFFAIDCNSHRRFLGPRDWIQRLPDMLLGSGYHEAQEYLYLELPHMAGFSNDV